MNEQRYQTLKAGDERRKGDEVRRVDVSKRGIPCKGLLRGYSTFVANPAYLSIDEKQHEPILGSWKLVQLVGHEIFASDLMILEFRRPV
jgi:hypothetical protein